MSRNTSAARVPRKAAQTSSRERIIQAAVDLVCEGGPGAATARAICERANTTAPTLYHFFGDLYQLYDEVLQLMYVPEARAYPGREFEDPRGMIEYMWNCCVDTAKRRPGIDELKSQLVSMGKTPDSMMNFYARLQVAFEQLALREPLNFPPKTAAAMYWSAAVGAAHMITAARHNGVPYPSGTDKILYDSMLAAILAGDPVKARASRVAQKAPPQAPARRTSASRRSAPTKP